MNNNINDAFFVAIAFLCVGCYDALFNRDESYSVNDSFWFALLLEAVFSSIWLLVARTMPGLHILAQGMPAFYSGYIFGILCKLTYIRLAKQ
jgi:hypothetical protein